MMRRDEMESRRLRAAEFLKNGGSQSAVSWVFGVSRTTASRWLRKWKRGGTAALARSIGSGRPCRMTPEQERTFRELWAMRWSFAAFQVVVEAEIGIVYDADHVGRIVHRMGLRPVRMRRSMVDDAIQAIRSVMDTVPTGQETATVSQAGGR